MKLVRCNHCQDIFNLTLVTKSCGCGSVRGKYTNDGVAVEIFAQHGATILGFDNISFHTAVSTSKVVKGLGRNHKESGIEFTAFVIDPDVETVSLSRGK